MNKSTVSNEVLEMVQPWLTGENERDAQSLQRSFKGIRFTIGEWRELVKQAQHAYNVKCRKAGQYAKDHCEEYCNRN